MNKVLFLFLVILFCATIVFASEHPGEERRFRKRARECKCSGSSRVGDYWLWRGSCPGGYGYTSNCIVSSSICCLPRA
uniref:Type III potassium channel toxin protein n=1 Tax=Anemonia sulcata TaxID=6108 RepID=A0A0S1M1B5_ANESU|nr:type III potassium channel toxin protein [Anemonia sulcata]